MTAHALVSEAIKKGELRRPSRCQLCGTGGRIVAHHRDYAAPLSVEWLCIKCHRAWHSENGRGLSAELMYGESGKVPVLVRLDPLMVERLDAYIAKLTQIGGSGSRASVATKALQLGLEVMRKSEIVVRKK